MWDPSIQHVSIGMPSAFRECQTHQIICGMMHSVSARHIIFFFSKGSNLPLRVKSKRELHNTHQLNKGQEKKREGNDRQHGLFDLRIPLMMLRERLSSQLRHLLIVSCFEDRNDLTIYHQSSRLSALLSSLGNTCWNKFITRFITRTSSSSRGFLSC